uniref:Uncharacterized protein n=1 Tax=viral metagenome TaxID=1070528 RepID=A0A6C0D2C5_9ZZZZ
MKPITFDELFSVWIFVWFILYYLNLTQYSPKFWLILITVYATLSIVYMVYIQLKTIYILIVVLLMVISKIIPLYIIFNDNIKINDILFGFGLGIIYLLWLNYKKVNVFTIYLVDMFNYNMPFAKMLDI